MGLYGYSHATATNQPAQWKPSLPYQQSGPSRASSYGDRQFPERMDVSDPGIKLIGEAARFPGYIYDRIPAVANVATGGLLDKAIKTAESVPGIGTMVKGIGTAFDISASLFPAAYNSFTANMLRDTAKMPDNAPFSGLNRVLSSPFDFSPLNWLSDQRSATIGDYRKAARDRGFTQEDIESLVSRRASSISAIRATPSIRTPG